MPTILEAIGSELARGPRRKADPALRRDEPRLQLRRREAKSRHSTQYFEVFGHRAIYHDGWMASAFRGRAPWRVLDPFPRPLEEDRWELYDLEHDFSQAPRSRGRRSPSACARSRRSSRRRRPATRVLPLGDDTPGAGLPKLHQDRRHFVFYEGAVGIPESGAPPIPNRSYEIRAQIEIPREDVSGVIVTEGGGVAGWALYIDRERRPAYHLQLLRRGAHDDRGRAAAARSGLRACVMSSNRTAESERVDGESSTSASGWSARRGSRARRRASSRSTRPSTWAPTPARRRATTPPDRASRARSARSKCRSTEPGRRDAAARRARRPQSMSDWGSRPSIARPTSA